MQTGTHKALVNKITIPGRNKETSTLATKVFISLECLDSQIPSHFTNKSSRHLIKIQPPPPLLKTRKFSVSQGGWQESIVDAISNGLV